MAKVKGQVRLIADLESALKVNSEKLAKMIGIASITLRGYKNGSGTPSWASLTKIRKLIDKKKLSFDLVNYFD